MKRFRKDLERTSTLLSKVKNPLHQEFTYSVSEGSTYKECDSINNPAPINIHIIDLDKG